MVADFFGADSTHHATGDYCCAMKVFYMLAYFPSLMGHFKIDWKHCKIAKKSVDKLTNDIIASMYVNNIMKMLIDGLHACNVEDSTMLCII